MKVLDNISIGFDGISAHKLRAFLTMLGIIFGVSAVIAMLSIGEGAKREAMAQIEAMGVNNIILQDADLKEQELNDARTAFSKGLTPEEAQAIDLTIPQIITTVPLRKEEVDIQAKNQKIKANLIGTTADYLKVNNFALTRGGFFDDEDFAQMRRICVIGEVIKRKLFPFSPAVGREIKIEREWFTVVGEMAYKEVSTKAIGDYRARDLNEDVIIPLSTCDKHFWRDPLKSPLDQIIVKVEKGSDIRALGNVLQRLLDRRHYNQKDFKVIIPEELLRQSQSTQRIFNIVMGAIAGISLLVGGIGIMNIMLSSVLERTREIGIRRAVGAHKREILGQFLTEAVALSFSGGILGVILGVVLAKIITLYAGWVTIVSFLSVMMAFGVASAIGLIFGLYPARRAANLNPIEALRYE